MVTTGVGEGERSLCNKVLWSFVLSDHINDFLAEVSHHPLRKHRTNIHKHEKCYFLIILVSDMFQVP